MSRKIGLLAVCWLLLTLSACAAPANPERARDVSAASTDAGRIAHIAAEPTTFTDFDPSSACTSELWPLINVYETLTTYALPGSAAPLAPGLATAWEVSSDGMAWTFHLRQGVTFHSGAALDAAAVKAAIERTIGIGQCSAYLFDAVASIATPDASTVVFNLAYPAPLDAILASPYGAWITGPGVTERDAAWFAAGNDDGTGPYRFAQYDAGQRLVLTRFADYWGGWQVGQFDTLVFEVLDDTVAAEQMLRAGELDFATQVNLMPEQMAALDAEPGLRLDVAPGVGNWVLLLNHRRAPTTDRRVRQALAYSFPYAAVVANSLLGYGGRSPGAVPTSVWGHAAAPYYAEDLDKARALLADAGFGEGLEIVFSYDPTEETLAELWQANLAQIGVNLVLEPADFLVRWEAAKSAPDSAPHAYMLGWVPDVVDPYSYLFNLFHTEQEPLWNMGFYSDPAFDALIDGARRQSATDQEAAAADYVAAQAILDGDGAAIYALDVPDLAIIAENIAGFASNPAYPHLAIWYDLRHSE